MARGRISYGVAVNLQQVVQEVQPSSTHPGQTRTAPSSPLADEMAGLPAILRDRGTLPVAAFAQQ